MLTIRARRMIDINLLPMVENPDSGRLRVAVHDPLGLEDRRRTPRADAPDQLGHRCFGSYLHGALFGSVEAGE
jgi:hypothetical protein